MSVGAGEFIEKVISHDIDGVARALADAPELAGVRDGYLGSTPLHFAAHRGFGRIVESLLTAGADVHARETASGTTAGRARRLCSGRQRGTDGPRPRRSCSTTAPTRTRAGSTWRENSRRW